MKTMLITATAVGAAIAGLILYYQRKSSTKNKLNDAATDAYSPMNEAMNRVERPAQHAMG